MPAPVTQNGLKIAWEEFLTISGIQMVSGHLSWSSVAICGGRPTSGYYLLTIIQGEAGDSTEYLAGVNSTSVPFTVPCGIAGQNGLYFSVAACYNSNIPPSGSGCPTEIGSIEVPRPIPS
jgi:hypothetical protein